MAAFQTLIYITKCDLISKSNSSLMNITATFFSYGGKLWAV